MFLLNKAAVAARSGRIREREIKSSAENAIPKNAPSVGTKRPETKKAFLSPSCLFQAGRIIPDGHVFHFQME
ncbi:MAG: hypothetical protein A2293_15675 [Elusimicrobia bacterium RIFOXYB2_FULL_49_7]|nr:MAG: hypothetical protein A2293_15675 [Elusimicrobia bacterium RIFOXYB2_FULL_49_7]